MKGRFYIAGKDKQSVTGVGCRIKVYREILETPSLKNGIARNADKNKVEILVEAEGNNAKDALEDFRKKVMTLELPDVSANPGFYVTELDIFRRASLADARDPAQCAGYEGSFANPVFA